MGCLAILIAAYGAHSLNLDAAAMQTFQTAFRYQMAHGLALLITGIVATRWAGWRLNAAAVLFVVGTVLFSGSLYLAAVTGVAWIGIITAPGGVALAAAWGLLFWAAFSAR